jgi:hypothetical protein
MIFRNSNNMYRTSDLFIEYNRSQDPAYWTIKGDDVTINGITYPSLKKIYLSYEDVMEYDFAVDHFEDYAHWEVLANSARLKDDVEQWRKELVLKLKTRALKGIIRDAVKENKYEANKFLLTNGWIDKSEDGKKRGRPTKQEIKDELQKQALTEKELLEDLNRLKELN